MAKPQFKKWRVLFTLLLGSVGAACEAPGVFRDVPRNLPHAVITSDNPPGFRGCFGRGREVFFHRINGQLTGFWRSRDTYRIPPGPTSVKASDSTEPYDYGPVMSFSAREGHRYTLRPTRLGDKDAVTLAERAPGGSPERVVGSALRDRE
ncbi:MAG: hypothetical protein V4675_07320 [Verrucomicrobiota bacterium]